MRMGAAVTAALALGMAAATAAGAVAAERRDARRAPGAAAAAQQQHMDARALAGRIDYGARPQRDGVIRFGDTELRIGGRVSTSYTWSAK
ncbi:hypothetical protein ACFFJB_08215 [Camelimonas abortus]|uniref:Uncharacterized protein n=1 Tax=Camelimonas abortus TaxID=1017184 RepID=A0ABV7LG94_9HYPH